MAQTVALTLEVDSGKSVQEVTKLEDAIKDIQKTTNVDNVGQKFDTLNASIKKGAGSVEDMRKAIKSYQTIALTAGRTSPIGKDALLRASELKDELTDLDNEVNRLSKDGQEMQGALQLGTTVIAGYQAFAGVIALVGEENEDLMKTMTKLQAVSSVLQGTEQVRLALEKESALMINYRTLKTKVLTGLNWAYNLSVGGGTKAMKLFRLALISTGLGALVVLIGTIIAKWDDWKDSIMSIINVAFYPLIKVLEYLGVIESDLEKQRRLANEQYLQQLQEQGKALDETSKKVQKRYDHEIKMLKIVGTETYKLEREKLSASIDGAMERQSLLEKELIQKKLSEEEFTEDQKQEYRDRIKELTEIQIQGFDELELLDAQHKQDLLKKEEAEQKERNANAKKWRDKKKAEDKRQAEADLKAFEDEQKLAEELRIQIEDFAIANIQGENERKLAELQIGHDREREQLVAKYGEDTELMKELELNQYNELSALINEIEARELEKKTLKDQAEVERLQKLADQKKAIEDKAKLDQEANDKAIIQSKQNLFAMSSSLAGNLATLFEKQNKVSKAFALAQIGIDTAKAISSLVAMSNSNPLNAPTGGIAGAIQYGAGIVSILSNMKRAYGILKSGSSVSAPSVSSGSRSSSGGSSSGSGSSSGTQNTGSTEFAQNNRVYLVESDVQAMRDKREGIEAVSVL